MSRHTVLPYEAFRATWGDLHDRLFSDRPAEERPFLEPSWRSVLLLDGLNMEHDIFYALRDASLSVGDEQAVIVGAHVLWPPPDAMVFPWDREVFEEVRMERAPVSAHMFGASGCWGLASDDEDDFCCLGGTESFLGTFASRLGGPNTVRERFFEFSQEVFGSRPHVLSTALRSVGWV
jgi:hypothetical protein